jgi:hypothetical protein
MDMKLWVFMATSFEEGFGELLKEIQLSLSGLEREVVLMAEENGFLTQELAKLLVLGIIQGLVGNQPRVNGI